jgi:hypothetical protein
METASVDARLRAHRRRADVKDGRTAFRPDRHAGILAPLTAPLGARSAEAMVTVEGPLSRPRGRIDASVEAPMLPGLAASRATLLADYGLAEGFGGPLTVGATLRFAGPMPADARLQPVLGDEVRLDAEGRVATDGTVEVTTARLQSVGARLPSLRHLWRGRPGGCRGFGGHTGPCRPAGTGGHADRRPCHGRHPHCTLADGALSGDVAADLRGLTLPQVGAAERLLGSEVGLAAEIERDAAGGWRVGDARLDGAALSAADGRPWRPTFRIWTPSTGCR